ncbi:MAG: hypothetical protein RLN82_12185, partial [Pseudomonadales bacterium]
MRLIAMLMFIPALASAAEPGGKSVAWLVGCWSTADGSALEVWVANNDQSLSGFGVALHNNKVG